LARKGLKRGRQHGPGKQPTNAPGPSTGAMDTARRDRGMRKLGRPGRDVSLIAIMLSLIKQWLTEPVETTEGDGNGAWKAVRPDQGHGVPQGCVIQSDRADRAALRRHRRGRSDVPRSEASPGKSPPSQSSTATGGPYSAAAPQRASAGRAALPDRSGCALHQQSRGAGRADDEIRQKISGGFRSEDEDSANDFAVIRSVLSTAILLCENRGPVAVWGG
jgi:hypothetical protein